MLELVAKYIQNYDTYSFMDSYESISECIEDLQTLSHKEILEQLVDDGSKEYQTIKELLND